MKDVFKRICYAQIASDGGKGIDNLKIFAPTIWCKGYSAKDREILRAINLINAGKGYSVKYSVKYDHTSRRMGDCYIVYFTYKVDGCRKQVSFHSFNRLLEQYQVANNDHIVRWDGKSSRQNVLELLSSFSSTKGANKR